MNHVEWLAVRSAVTQRYERIEGGDGLSPPGRGHVLRLVDHHHGSQLGELVHPGGADIPQVGLLGLPRTERVADAALFTGPLAKTLTRVLECREEWLTRPEGERLEMDEVSDA